MELIRCKHCLFFELDEKTWEDGWCKRYAPSPQLGKAIGEYIYTSWPLVLAESGCGDGVLKNK